MKEKSNPKLFPIEWTEDTYVLRGRNKVHALRNGLETEYDRLALLAVSVFDLAHWRLPITMDYLLMK